MPRITVQRPIDAPPERVFHAISHIEGLPDTNPAIVSVEFIGDQREGVGTRFRERRTMGREELVTELEVVAYDPEAYSVRMVADTHGTIWDTTMSVAPDGDGCILTIAMDARGSTWVKRTMNWLMQPMFKRGMTTHLADLAAYCERPES